ncbi:MAG TPA: H-X9-DG-CTERM domain-containing protein [Aggregatilineaceae bacterium]|nr:H-X9-DG-CTERM domain-containing protein [Aggregatilineaceae bacterium]
MESKGQSILIQVIAGDGLWFRKHSAMHDPGPSTAFVFIDNHRDTMADGLFALSQPFTPYQWSWAHFPDARHQNGANLSFADGRVEYWRWLEPNSLKLARKCGWGWKPTVPGDRDLSKLQACVPSARKR